MKNFTAFLFLLLGFCSIAQTSFDKFKYDFGDVDETTIRYVDFHIKNNSDKKAYLLTVQKPKNIHPREFSYLFDKKFLDPDSSMVLRFQINPQQKGKFKYEIPVFMSDRKDPTTLVLIGNVNRLTEEISSFQSCPNFNQRPNAGNPFDFKLTVKVIDKETREPIEKASVSLIRNGKPMSIWTMNRKGFKTDKAPLGLYYFYASKDGYFPNEKSAYVNFKRNLILIELDKDEVLALNPAPNPVPVPVEVVDPESVDTTEIVVVNIEEELEEQIKKEVELDSANISEVIPPKLSELPEDDFSEDNFKFNNIVFVIDKSGSMKKDGKLDLMKYSLNQLTEILRSQDRIGLVSYADDAEIILGSTTGNNKMIINERVSEMRAGGLTNGGKGIRIGLKLAKKNFIKGGNNEVIVITDGSFSKDSDDYWRHVAKYRRQGIKLSVVGIKNSKTATRSMTSVAEHGGGNYISINKLSDAQIKLIQQIKLNSFKY